MAEHTTAALSPAVSPSSEPPSGALTPTAGGTQRLLFTHDLVSGKHGGAMRFGLVRMIHGEEDFEDSDSEIGGGRGAGGGGGGCVVGGGDGGGDARGNSDNESGAADTRSWPLGRGFVRVQWYPEGTKQDVRETKLKLEDRSIVPRDFVRRMNSNDKQCGIVTNINTECALKLVGTNCVLYPVKSKDLQHVWSFMYGDYIVYDFWLGKVYDLSIQIIVKLSNGARCSMSEEDGAKLYDIYPHISDVGLFFDDAYGFYPGQVLIGPSKVFANVQWLYGVKPVLSKKSKFRVVVEEVQVVELKVTWITKSYSPKGSDSVFPPPSTITQENLGRVKRLGYFDHAQRQLGERALYVFPAKSETTHITCEGPEGTPAHPEDPVVRKLKRMFRKEPGKKITENSDTQNNRSQTTEKADNIKGEEKSVQEKDCPDDSSTQCCPNNVHVPCLDGLEEGKEPLANASQGQWTQLGEQESDDEAADDTDDTSSVTSSASSTVSLQSGPTRKKSIPLSIRNLKRKHKKKRTKFSHEFKPGDRVAVEVVSTVTSADVMWKNGRFETDIRSNDLIPIQHLDNHEFCPGDYVVDKRPLALEDPGVYGVIQSGDHKARTCVVKWVRLNAAGSDVEVIGEEEDVSVYDIADHPDFHFHTTDIVIRIGNSNSEDCENERSVGQVCRVELSSKVEVVWADNSKTIVLPQHLYNVESEIEETYYDSTEGSSSGASSEEWVDESDSWETDNGQVEEEPGGGDAAPVSYPTTGYDKIHGVNASTTTDSPGAVSTPELPGDTHSFKKMEFQPAEAKKFFSTVRKEMALLATSLPDGIMVKTFEDRMDLFSALIKGPNRTPYEDGLFLFDIQLPNIYPAVPPLFYYLSQCSGRLNPNLYDNGKVCVSLLGTWIGKGTERWTSKSSLLQVLISIQGLILVNEPYYNEAGFDSDRGLQEGYENSRCYNEMVLIKMVQSMTQLLLQPVEVFQQEIREHFACGGWRLVHRLESWLELEGAVTDHGFRRGGGSGSLRAEPLEEIPTALVHSSPSKHDVWSEEELENSGLSPSTSRPSGPLGEQQDLSQNSDCGSLVVGAESEVLESPEGLSGFVLSQQTGKPCQEFQPVVRPKKRRKSYRSFLPERSDYPDIGFPLFPLSKGFEKSMRVVLQQYRATLTSFGVPEHPENK
ncbi:(E3-independent) E2 ubiquitin-conjugating enzyme-like isoform X4 [Myxocyprinus asiaticus]|uniref:(E3-independent) E2 ubiquitin-conjugating enzyme-like isoform X4 n=1 Tax=Myxocyprinus asiaticus TaxID=70543 RepID=UPI002221E9A8|nr:(E3-independent) E2 ubiquitin-conjugating enzyme-like isoform X4 [Myxocyprinus asiaticus]